MKTRRLFKITIFIISALLILSIVINVSCTSMTPPSTTQETTTQSSISTPEESAGNETNNINNIKALVEEFGKMLVNVSLLSPPDILENDMKKYYSPFVSEELILKWIKNPSEALGRLTSSPWPDHIEIIDVKKITADKYEVLGNVVEITSTEVEKGGYADKYEINLTVERINGNWLIAEAIKEIATGSETTADQRTLMEDFDRLIAREGVRSYEISEFLRR